MSLRRLARLAASLLGGIAFAAGATLPTVPAAAPEPVPSYAAAGLLQAGLGLAMVLALIFLCAWAARRFGLNQSNGERLLQVVSSVMVGQRERVVVVEIGKSWLVLGVSAGQVQALHTMPAEERAAARAAPNGDGNTAVATFSKKLRDSLNRLGSPGRQE